MKKLHRHSTKLTRLLLSLLCFSLKFSDTLGYSQVIVNRNDGALDEGPKIFKALNMDLIYPRTFNSSENVFSTARTLVTTTASTDPTLTNMKESQQQQQQDLSPEVRARPMAAKYSMIYVTPANDIALQLTTNNYESNIKASLFHTATTTTTPSPTTSTRPININPMMTVDNEQQSAREQSTNVNEMPEDMLLSPTREEYASTGRAVDYNRPVYTFNQLITPLIKSPPPPLVAPSSSSSVRAHTATRMPGRGIPPQRISNIGHIIYPQAYNQRRQPPNRAEINKLNGKAQFSDRFTPGEAVASAHFKQHHHHHGHTAGNIENNKVAAASQIVQKTYKPPTDLYAFPPNINAQYTSPYQDPKASLPSSNVNSYVAAPSGPIQANSNYPLVAAASNNDPGYKYPGPTNPDAGNGDVKMPMTSSTDDQNVGMNGGGASDADTDSGSDDTIGVLPASAMGDGENNMGGKDMDDGNGGGGDDAGADMAVDHDHDHPPPVDDTEYPTPPPGWVEEHPDTLHDHHPHLHGDYPELHNDDQLDYHHHHHHLPTYPQYDHPYPQIIIPYDHHNHPPLPPPPKLPPVTSEMPPPEPPPEPRVKKYSYFYIGRKLWYIPLYFTVWFSFYVLWLILKSIARHKVNLPNHYVNKRSLPDFGISSEVNSNEYINKLTVSVLEKIETFERKYLT